MEEIVLEAEVRDINNNLKKIRQSGKIPAIFYGAKENPIPLSIDRKKFEKIVHKGVAKNLLITLKIGQDTKNVLIKDIQRDILSQTPIHVDFQSISMKDKIEVSVPLHIEGEAPGVKLSGGVLEIVLREIRIRCLPADIPQKINVDVSKLQINQSFAVKDLPPLEGVEILSDKDSIICHIVAPTILEEKPASAEAQVAPSATEPEVIGKGKKEKEEETEVDKKDKDSK